MASSSQWAEDETQVLVKMRRLKVVLLVKKKKKKKNQ